MIIALCVVVSPQCDNVDMNVPSITIHLIAMQLSWVGRSLSGKLQNELSLLVDMCFGDALMMVDQIN